MIATQTIVDRLNFLLDAEGSDRYTFDEDFKYAIGSAVENTVSIMNAAFAQNKLSEEALRDLSYMRIFQASIYSRVAFDPTQLGHSCWTILSVHPNPVLIPASYSLPAATAESTYLYNASFRSATRSAKRLTSEEWSLKDRNSLMAGSSLMTCVDLMEAAYTNFSIYTGGYSLTRNTREIEIAPDISGQAVAVRYAAMPESPTTLASDIQLPNELTNMVTDLALKYIGIKQGERPTFDVSTKEINDMASLMS